MQGDKVFFLSAEEAENNSYGFKDKKVYTAEKEWWTRSGEGFYESFGQTKAEVGIVLTPFGGLLRSPVTARMYTRPALNLHTSRVLFASLASGGKVQNYPQGAVCLEKVAKVSQRKHPGWKLTLQDDSRQTFTARFIARSNNTLTIAYQNAAIYDKALSPNERISAILTDSSGADIGYYANIAVPLQPQGSAQIDLSCLKRLKGERLFVFSEQCNGDNRTDYASPLVEIILADGE